MIDAQAKPGMLCPLCRTDLMMTDRQGVEVDYCPRCRGVWLDRGELDKIIARSAAMEPASPQPAARGPAPAPVQGGYDPGYDGRRRYRDDDDDDDDRRDPRHRHRRRKSWLGEILDFD